jgi:hypothetical protein
MWKKRSKAMLDKLLEAFFWKVIVPLVSAAERVEVLQSQMSPKQNEAIGRYMHTLSSASLIGGLTYPVTQHFALMSCGYAFILIVVGVLLFQYGLRFLREQS